MDIVNRSCNYNTTDDKPQTGSDFVRKSVTLKGQSSDDAKKLDIKHQ